MATAVSSRRKHCHLSLDQVNVNSVGNETESANRYYLHHHSPSHGHNRPLNIIRRHLSSSVLGHGSRTTSSGSMPTSATPQHQQHHGFHRSLSQVPTVVQPEGPRSISSSGLLYPSGTTEDLALAGKHVTKGHLLTRATCTRLRLFCETCLHSVHRHHYLYCEHCPLVCHNRTDCITKVPRACPSEELGIYGWGESKNEIRVIEPSVIDFDEVYLSGSVGLQANKCFECGRILDPSIGHELVTPKAQDAANSTNGHRHGKLHTSKLHRSTSKDASFYKQNDSHQHDSGGFRVCHLTGKLYCDRCHWNDKWYIPGSIFLLNDPSMLPVCRSAYLRLRVLWESVVVKLPAYWHRENRQAAEVFSVRTRLHQLMRHTLVCSSAASLKDRMEIIEPAHLLGYPSYMRMCDVMEVLNNTLLPRLTEYANSLSEHMKDCEHGIAEESEVEEEESPKRHVFTLDM